MKAQSTGPDFLSIYLAGGRGAAEGAIARAKAAGYKALFVTIDTPVAGNRERDVRNGMKALMGKSPFAKLPYLPNILAHPRWLAAFIADGMARPFPNIVVPGSGPLAGDRCRRGAGIGASVLDRSQMDPRAVERPHCDEGRDDGG